MRTFLTFIAFTVIILPVIEPYVMSMSLGDKTAYYICLFIVLRKVSVKVNERSGNKPS